MGRASITSFPPTTDQPIEVFTVSRRVGYSDLDLKTYAGVKTLEKRVQDSVNAACRALDAQFPLDPRQTSSCSRQARNDAMAQVRAAIAAAAKIPPDRPWYSPVDGRRHAAAVEVDPAPNHRIRKPLTGGTRPGR